MGAYLIDHPPRRSQFSARSRSVSGVLVIHTAESVADTAAVDSGAEGVAAFIRGRSEPGSYHWLADSDSLIDLVPMHLAAYGDGTGSNPHAVHISAAAQAARWASLPDEWVEATVRNMALAAHRASNYVESVHKIRIPAKRISRAESDRPGEGFISHGERDPGRRTDPGATFPWPMLLDFYSDYEAGRGPGAEPALTRGEAVDKTIRVVSRAIKVLEDAKGAPARREQIDTAEATLVQARRQLRDIAFLDSQEG